MKNILIALDGSANAREVALVGKKLAEKFEASVTLLHVLLQSDNYYTPQYAPILGFNENYNNQLSEIMDSEVLRNTIQDFLEDIKEACSLKNASIIIQSGSPEKVISEAIQEREIDLLVIGKQSGLFGNKKRVGHVTESVLKQAAIPVFVIPTTEK